MDKKIIIVRTDPESMEFFVNDAYIGYANHDEHGWVGMESLEALATKIGKELGIEVIYKEE